MEFSTPFPGYHSIVSKSVGTLGEVLTGNGYSTAWFGKNHNVPDWLTTPAGPFNLWPSGLGFEYFYGFLGADAHQFRPAIYENNLPIDRIWAARTPITWTPTWPTRRSAGSAR